MLSKDIKPHFLSSEGICLDNQFGAILSRTYSDAIDQKQAYQLYQRVYDSGKYGEAIIDFLNKNIINDDTITLYF